MNNTPENLLQTLKEATTYAYVLEELIEEKDYQQDAIINAQNEPATKKAHEFFYGLRIIASGFLILLTIIVVSMILLIEDKQEILIIILSSLIIAIIPLALALLSSFLIHKGNKKVKELKKQLPEKLKKLQAELDETENKIKRLISEINDIGILNIIPKRYFNTEALVFFQQSLQNKMANTLKECILLYEQELKHQQMLNQQMAIAEYQSTQLDDLTREVEYNNMLTWINNNKN
ncbi:MAG: hypothetical protein IJW96_00040 [Clostridia bacterium]|nr:hypothetical protein [Clostridia bacterium]